MKLQPGDIVECVGALWVWEEERRLSDDRPLDFVQVANKLRGK